MDRRREIGVLVTTVHLERVDSVLVNALAAYANVRVYRRLRQRVERMCANMRGAKNRASPVGHEKIFGVV